jgi:hypothetical protein
VKDCDGEPTLETDATSVTEYSTEHLNLDSESQPGNEEMPEIPLIDKVNHDHDYIETKRGGRVAEVIDQMQAAGPEISDF